MPGSILPGIDLGDVDGVREPLSSAGSVHEADEAAPFEVREVDFEVGLPQEW